MKKRILITILAFATAGCATLARPGGPFYHSRQELKLSRAVALLEQGKAPAAAELLAAICAEPMVPGVTDEALFRLTLLRLGAGGGTGAMVQTQSDLERLAREYPASSWTPLAASLTGFLAVADDALQKERTLKELNSSLARGNGELKERNLALTKEQRELKELNLSLAREQRALKELNLSLTQENKELRESIEKLKNLELELDKGSKR